jgi:hypothetical protein
LTHRRKTFAVMGKSHKAESNINGRVACSPAVELLEQRGMIERVPMFEK